MKIRKWLKREMRQYKFWVLVLSALVLLLIGEAMAQEPAIAYRIIEGEGAYYIPDHTNRVWIEDHWEPEWEELPNSETQYAVPEYYIIGNQLIPVVEQ